MIYKRMTSRYLLVPLALLALILVAPAAAQGTSPQEVQPGDTIEVGSEPLVLDLVDLRNADTFNPITELRHYRDDDPTKQIIRVIGVPNDDRFTINTHTLNGKYGRYFAYSSKDGLIQQHSIVFTPAPGVTATESTGTPATATQTPTETGTPPATTTTAPTQAPLPGLIAIAALGICGLFLGTRRR